MTLSLIAPLLPCKVSSVQPCSDLDLKAPHGSLGLSSPSDFTSQSSLVNAQVPSLQASPQCFRPQTTVHSLSLPVATSPPSFSPLPPAAPIFFLIFPLLPNLTEIQLSTKPSVSPVALYRSFILPRYQLPSLLLHHFQTVTSLSPGKKKIPFHFKLWSFG